VPAAEPGHVAGKAVADVSHNSRIVERMAGQCLDEGFVLWVALVARRLLLGDLEVGEEEIARMSDDAEEGDASFGRGGAKVC
jgi:hypothetical protein